MAEEKEYPGNVYGSNRPASEDRPEPNIRDRFSPEQVDAQTLVRHKLEREKEETERPRD